MNGASRIFFFSKEELSEKLTKIARAKKEKKSVQNGTQFLFLTPRKKGLNSYINFLK